MPKMERAFLALKMTVFWVVTHRSLVEVCGRFRGRPTCCLHLQGAPETLVNFFQAASDLVETFTKFCRYILIWIYFKDHLRV